MTVASLVVAEQSCQCFQSTKKCRRLLMVSLGRYRTVLLTFSLLTPPQAEMVSFELGFEERCCYP